MDKIKLNLNYLDYEKVKNAFNKFVHDLVWESIDLCEGVEDSEVNEYIEKYCTINTSNDISSMNKKFQEFCLSQVKRYDVHLYDCDEDGNLIEETAIHFNTDNLNLALKRAAEFYRYHSDKHPTVNIFDNEINEYIAEWD